MIAKPWNLNAILFGCLEDGKIAVHLIRFIVDEDFNLFSGEGGVWSTQTSESCHS